MLLTFQFRQKEMKKNKTMNNTCIQDREKKIENKNLNSEETNNQIKGKNGLKLNIARKRTNQVDWIDPQE